MKRAASHATRVIDLLEPRRLLSTVSVSPAIASESSGVLTFHIALDAPATKDLSLAYSTRPLTATPGKDYKPGAGKVTIPAGQLGADVSVPLKDDALYEGDETLQLDVKSRGVKFAKASAKGTITEDDAAPTVTARDVTTKEGNAGAHEVVVAISLSQPAGTPITLNYKTSDDTPYSLAATAGSDYVAAKGSVTFLPGERKKTIHIRVIGDDVREADEVFRVTLTGPDTADAAATVTIKNDDKPAHAGAPVLSIADSFALEGNDGPTQTGVTVTLSKKSDKDVTFHYSYPAARATSARPDASSPDYVPASGTLTIPAGQTSATIPLTLLGDNTYEPNQTFEVRLSKIKNARPLNDCTEISSSFTVFDDEPVIFADSLGNLVAGISGVSVASDQLVDYYITGAAQLPVLLSSSTLVGNDIGSVTSRFPDYTLTAVAGNAYVFNIPPNSSAVTDSYQGSGSLTLTAVSVTNAGILTVSGISTGTLAGLNVSGATLDLAGNNTVSPTGAGTITLTGTGTMTYSGSLSNTSKLHVGGDLSWPSTLTGTIVTSVAVTESTLPTLAPGAKIVFQPGGSLTLTAASPDAVRAAILSALNAPSFSDATGITSTQAIADPAHQAVGYRVNPDGSVLIQPAAFGDANLDGVVDATDSAIVQQSLADTTPASWSAGDFNYDGAINADDLALLNQNLPPSP